MFSSFSLNTTHVEHSTLHTTLFCYLLEVAVQLTTSTVLTVLNKLHLGWVVVGGGGDKHEITCYGYHKLYLYCQEYYESKQAYM